MSITLDRTIHVIAWLAVQLLVGVACFVCAILGQYFLIDGGTFTYFNFVTGIAIATVLLTGPGMLPGIVAGTFLGFLYLGIGAWIGSIEVIVLSVEAIAIYFLLIHRLKFDCQLGRIADVLHLIVGAGLGITSLTAVLETLLLFFYQSGFSHGFAAVWLENWMGKLTGVLLVAPFLLVWGRFSRPQPPYYRGIELVSLITILVITCGLVFLDWLGLIDDRHSSFPLAFLFFPIIAWASFRFGQQTATLVCMVIAGFALWALDRFTGPFARETLFESHVLTWLCINTGASVSMLLAADITQCKRVRFDLRKSDERLDLATRGSQDGLWDWSNVDEDYIWWSSRFYELIGFDPQEIESSHTSLMALMHPEDRTRHMSQLSGHLSNRHIYNIDYRLRTKYHGYRWFHAKGEACLDEKSGITRMAGSIIDVHERIQAQEEVVRLNQELEKRVVGRTTELLNANQELRNEIASRNKAEKELAKLQNELLHISRISTMGELSTALAHELHQPLTAIVNYSQSSLMDLQVTDDKGELSENIAEISRQALKAGTIIGRLRNYLTKNETDRVKVTLNHVIEDLMPILELEAKQTQTRLEVIYDSSNSLVWANEIELQQVIANLCRNGIEAMAQNQRNEKILLIKVEKMDNEFLCFSAVDRGGVNFVHSPKLFDSFYTTKPHGLGMGLAICNTVILSHGGSLTLVANQDVGVTASFLLPLTH